MAVTLSFYSILCGGTGKGVGRSPTRAWTISPQPMRLPGRTCVCLTIAHAGSQSVRPLTRIFHVTCPLRLWAPPANTVFPSSITFNPLLPHAVLPITRIFRANMTDAAFDSPANAVFPPSITPPPAFAHCRLSSTDGPGSHRPSAPHRFRRPMLTGFANGPPIFIDSCAKPLYLWLFLCIIER